MSKMYKVKCALCQEYIVITGLSLMTEGVNEVAEIVVLHKCTTQRTWPQLAGDMREYGAGLVPHLPALPTPAAEIVMGLRGKLAEGEK